MTPGIDVAVVGLSCRFPGADHPITFWENLLAGSSNVGEAPPDRWTVASKSTRYGGFVRDAERFDAGFFAISPREARSMDPQQCMLLELAWQALEDAAMRTNDLRRQRWGVFVGASADDFRTRYLAAGDLDRFGHTGTSRCMLANRLSHRFGLSGPSEVIDTGQSSSLTAVHRAISSLRLGECNTALVGGVNVILLPEVTEQIALWGALSPDGRCFSMDQRANGYVRGEGAACVILKTLDDARRDRDHIYCVIRGSAVSNDAGDGALGTPAKEGQKQVIDLACRAAGVSPADVTYVELHGTGTPAGDSVEAAAIGETIGAARPAGSPVTVGSVKTNIGHLEAASGIAGLVKVCLMVHHRTTPASLNFERGRPDLDSLNLRVPVDTEELPLSDAAVVGISSFGMGGSNAHVIVGAPPPQSDTGQDGDTVWCLSGDSPAALKHQAQALLDSPVAFWSLPRTGWTLTGRTHTGRRAVVLGSDHEDMCRGLRLVIGGRTRAVPEGWIEGRAGRERLSAAADRYLGSGDTQPLADLLNTGTPKIALLPTYPFGGGAEADPSVAAAARPPFLREWRTSTTRSDRTFAVQAMLQAELSAVLDGPARAIDPDAPFQELGLDSMTVLELLDKAAAAAQVDLASNLAFDHPTLSDLAERINKEMEDRHDSDGLRPR